MINKILVPLDGSKLAECALSYAEEMATRMGVDEVDLISVTERVQGFRLVEDPTSPTEGRLMAEAAGKMTAQATRYLNRVAKGLEAKGVKVVKEVLYGNPAEEIIIYGDTRGCNLIIMSSHGKSGPSKCAFGSVSEKVLRGVRVPIMIIRAPGCVATA